MKKEDVIDVDTVEGEKLFDGASVKGQFRTICRYFVRKVPPSELPAGLDAG